MNDGLKTEPERLREMAGQLKASTDALSGTGQSAPPPPEVTTSSERVGHTLTEIMNGVAALTTAVQDTSSKIDASDGSYAESDNRSVEGLHQVPKFTR